MEEVRAFLEMAVLASRLRQLSMGQRISADLVLDGYEGDL